LFLGDDALIEVQKRALNVISHSTNLMLRIVNDVLDLSRLDWQVAVGESLL